WTDRSDYAIVGNMQPTNVTTALTARTAVIATLTAARLTACAPPGPRERSAYLNRLADYGTHTGASTRQRGEHGNPERCKQAQVAIGESVRPTGFSNARSDDQKALLDEGARTFVATCLNGTPTAAPTR